MYKINKEFENFWVGSDSYNLIPLNSWNLNLNSNGAESETQSQLETR